MFSHRLTILGPYLLEDLCKYAEIFRRCVNRLFLFSYNLNFDILSGKVLNFDISVWMVEVSWTDQFGGVMK